MMSLASTPANFVQSSPISPLLCGSCCWFRRFESLVPVSKLCPVFFLEVVNEKNLSKKKNKTKQNQAGVSTQSDREVMEKEEEVVLQQKQPSGEEGEEEEEEEFVPLGLADEAEEEALASGKAPRPRKPSKEERKRASRAAPRNTRPLPGSTTASEPTDPSLMYPPPIYLYLYLSLFCILHNVYYFVHFNNF
jgi:hypothetical protein